MPDIPGDEQAKPNPRHRTEADQLDAGNANTANAKMSNEALSLLERQSLSKNPVSGTGTGHEGKGDLSRKEPFTGKSTATSEVIRNGQLLVSNLRTPDIDVDDPKNQTPKPGDQKKEQSKDSLRDKSAAKPYFESTEVTEEEITLGRPQFPFEPNIPPDIKKMVEERLNQEKQKEKELLKNVKELINKIGGSPKDALIDAVRNSKVVGIGEMHARGGVSPLRDLGTSVMQDLHDRGGATHLAVEFPKILQPVFDKFNNDPNKGELEIPDKIIGPDGKEDTSEEARGALRVLHWLKEGEGQDLMIVPTAARNAGMKVVCVDNNNSALAAANPKHPSIPRLYSSRDQDMKDNVMGILDQQAKPGNPPPKVVAWLGSLHLMDSHGAEKQKSAGELLRAELEKHKQKITIFGSQVGEGRSAHMGSLFPLTTALARPVSITTHDQAGQTNVLGRTHMLIGRPEGTPDHNLSGFDHMLIFPKAKEPEVRALEQPRLSDQAVSNFNIKHIAQNKLPDKELQLVIDKMKSTRPAEQVKPGEYLAEATNDNEKARAVKQEINREGKPPSELLAEALRNSRVLGIEQINSYDNALAGAAYSLALMKSLKDAGATHLAVPYKQDVLDQFMKTGKVDSIEVTEGPAHRLASMTMQAALQNGIKLVTSLDRFDIPSNEAAAKAVKDVLKDKNTKVILLTHVGMLSNTGDQDGKKSTGQVLRDEQDPANVATKIKLTTVKQVDPHTLTDYEPVSAFIGNLRQPVAVPIVKTNVLPKVEATYFRTYKQRFESWDI